MPDLIAISPRELATIAAKQAFHQVELNPDGRIGLDEFKRWYSSPGSHGAATALPSNHLFTLQVARRLTQLERHAPDTVFELLADCADNNGNLTKDAFSECFQVHFLTTTPDARSIAAIHRLFDIFDADGNGTVDFAELAAGLSLLCGGGREDKVRAAFVLYDYNQDGVISLDKMVRLNVTSWDFFYAWIFLYFFAAIGVIYFAWQRLKGGLSETLRVRLRVLTRSRLE
ncbi:hypothetical protein H310_12497 [Aphanomyces invadans]|uniref:EF-hand domain-containing protein n=1 Tax=Aphanomyces invadans TaxID=157072 RepID=A0A024THC6_9STRA|nr:hypothetical protein H310_12497 [Aphanomyces invadans]ETV93443.1 hypothetical protein H310_12497 [Aphanomyces invadans]|eukprot:XP_008877785.1 hypothetical protein H310_12497 [Aphanomyces invadans]